MTALLSVIALVLLLGASLVLLISHHWRWSIVALALQYVAVFLLVQQVWPLGLSAVKLVVGWMAGAVLTASQPEAGLEEDAVSWATRIFRTVAAFLVWLVAYALSPVVVEVIGGTEIFHFCSLVLVGMGLLQLGVSTRPLRIILGLLTALAGFELLYAVVEDSIMVAGLLAALNLGLSMAGAYFLSLDSTEESR
ncbi:MAG TPA: hypothetical protein PKG95_04420 [Anaerolineaceae bacterium]|jgi:hypothetical protein|nr:hypothetical protein [Anaerolineaceae bacterium]